jgi:hypothetical protein
MRQWWLCTYSNEFFLLVPGLTWFVFRTTYVQRTCDLARTLPVLVWIPLLATGHVANATVTAIVVLSWTLVANVAMYFIDSAHMKMADVKLRGLPKGADVLFAVCLVSPSALITGSPTFWLDEPKNRLRFVCIAANIILVTYLTWVFLVTVPFEKAWGCYPHKTTVADYTFGYCPQHYDPPQNHNLNQACHQMINGGFTPTEQCYGATASNSVHRLMGTIAHTAAHLLAVSATVYIAQIPAAIEYFRLEGCPKLE